jgi:hypothetical protein
MTLEQYLHFTAHLDWLPAEAIALYLDSLGLWPEDTPQAVKVRDVARGLSATDATGWPLVARLKQGETLCLYKQEAAFTADDYRAVIQDSVTHVHDSQQQAQAARDAAVQQGDAHLVLPWEEPPGH